MKVYDHHPNWRPVVKGYRSVHRAGGTPELLHRKRAEQALGHPLPPKAQVHHVDGTKSDGSPLVICQDRAYHALLHARTRIVRAGGNPNTDRICGRCQRVLPLATMFYGGGKRVRDCRDCRAAWRAANRATPGYRENWNKYQSEWQRRKRQEQTNA